MSDDNPSNTLDGSSGVPFEIDAGDRQGDTGPLRLRRIKTGGAVDELQGELDAKLYGLPSDQRANLAIPTAKEQSSSELEGDNRENMLGRTQQSIEISRLSDRLAVLTATTAKMHANGEAIPLKLANEITSLQNTIDFQVDRMNATTPDPAVEEAQRDEDLLVSAFENDMTAAVGRMCRQHGVDKAMGMTLVQQMINAVGIEKVLPHYAKANARINKKSPPAD